MFRVPDYPSLPEASNKYTAGDQYNLVKDVQDKLEKGL